MEKLAILGGNKVKTTPYGEGERFGEAELRELEAALKQNTLFYVKSNAHQVKRMTEKMAEMYGMEYCVATSSGTASVHVALGALGITAGDEVITTPVTDMGTIIGILAQNAIPVFADIDPNNFNIDAKSIEKCITDKTKAIIAVHLAAVPCDMDAIMAVARKHNVKVIEDCCQAFGCKYKGRYVGTIGDIGCFSFNEYKHIVAGDGGCVLVNGEDMFYKCHRFADKEYDRFGKEIRKIPFLAPNYRMNELTASCVLGQLTKADFICRRREEVGNIITRGLKEIPGIISYNIGKDDTTPYLWYMFCIDEEKLGVSRNEFTEALCAEGISAGKGYLATCVYMYDLFQNKSAYQNTHCPFDCRYYGKNIEYKEGLAPVAEKVLKTAVRLPITEFMTDEDSYETVRAVKKVAEYYLSRK